MPTDEHIPSIPQTEQFAELAKVVGGLAHEIKNPLSTINLNLKLLGEDLARHPDAEHRRLTRRLECIQDETDRVRQILDDFLRYAGHCELQTCPVNLNDLISEMTDFFAPQADAAHTVLRSSLPQEAIYCPVDAKLIKQVLLNLMLNATQAMPKGGELLLKLFRNEQNAIIEIIDTGPGIDPEQMEHIFEAYWTTKPQGSGLGLPTAKRIIREHQGALSVDSEPGRGTRFIIRLPLETTA